MELKFLRGLMSDLKPPKKHPELYVNDGNLRFKDEHYIYCLVKSTLIRGSRFFEDMFSTLVGHAPEEEGSSEEHAIKIPVAPGDNDKSFELAMLGNNIFEGPELCYNTSQSQ